MLFTPSFIPLSLLSILAISSSVFGASATHDVTPTRHLSKHHPSHASLHPTTSKVHTEPSTKHHHHPHRPTTVPALHHSKHHKFHKHHHHHKHGNATEVHPGKHNLTHGKHHGAPKETRRIETASVLPKHHHHHHHHHHQASSTAPHSTVIPVVTKSQSRAAPTSSQTGAPRSPASSLEAEALKAHNDLRAKHGAKDLVWSDKLAKVAQAWGDKCVFEHGGGRAIGSGENLAAMSGTSNSISEGIALWTAEAPDYDPSTPVFSHFTQMVWKGTSQVGCSVSACNLAALPGAGLSNFFVCEYLSPGNVIGEFAQNVQA